MIIAPKLILKNKPTIYIVASTFNKPIVDELISGSIDTFHKSGIDDITTILTPGAYELPWTIKMLLEKKKNISGIVAIGALIKGETSHFDHISSQVSSNLATISLETMIPITFGVLTTENTEQALARTGIKTTNKGSEAALALIELLSLKELI